MTSPDRHVVIGEPPGPVLRLAALGAAVARLEVTCGDGVRRDVVLGGAGGSDDFLGATIGRFANRIGGGSFELDGREHRLATNEGTTTLHGGPEGFDRRVWDLVDADGSSARWRLTSPDGDQGFPGRLVAEAAYAVVPDGFRLTLTATTDAPTVVNLTHHGYAALDGSGSIDDHVLTVPAGLRVPVDDHGLPTGDPVAVEPGHDLRGGRRLGDVGTLDHTFVVPGRGVRPVAVLTAPATRTTVTVLSDQPGVQVYTGDWLRSHPARAGVALEPQRFPDTPRHEGRAGWPSAVLRPGEEYRHVLEWRFS
jgi:aldose 1-epimerase